MIFANRYSGPIVTLFLLTALKPTAFSQAKDARSLVRGDVVVRQNKPTVYICVDKEPTKKKVNSVQQLVWLKISNNTIWTIRFRAQGMGTRLKLHKLSNGTIISGLTNESVAFPQYELDRHRVGTGRSGPTWGDVGSVSWLPSNTTARFSVPARYFAAGLLLLEYKYEWEFTGAVADESNGPHHRVYFAIGNLSDLSASHCD